LFIFANRLQNSFLGIIWGLLPYFWGFFDLFPVAVRPDAELDTVSG